jgi:phosphatidylserine/phosphatidylglycerophosphate/cardiolipin synthase-like enzyme
MKYALVLLILTACAASVPEETGSIEAFFCDQTDCEQVFANRTAGAKSVDCAMYHPNNAFLEMLSKKESLLVTDEGHPASGAVVEFGSGLMHNKFCVFGDYVWTGSWNPAQEMSIPNNVVLIKSKTLASAYRSEFEELAQGVFHGGRKNSGLVKLNGQLAEAYFCPEDNCQFHVLDTLENAKKSVHFMVYSFTDDSIGDLLLSKKLQGLDIKGVFRAKNDKGGEYPKLKDFSNTGNVHHKVFIIDGSTVITGSYNPSESANERNDENIVIIRDAEIAQKFEEEFMRFT